MSADIVQLSPEKIKFNAIDEAIAAIRHGGFVVLSDDEGRENDGCLVCAAAGIAPDMVNFMMKEARGQITVAMTRDRAMDLELVSDDNAYMAAVDAGSEFGVSNGMSAMDRATTIQRLASSNAVAADFVRPGYITPTSARDGGVLRYVGVAEAATDIARLGGFTPMGVVCQILNDDGGIARRDELAAFAKKHDMPFVTTAQLIEYRLERERFVLRKLAVEMPTRYGDFTAVGYKDMITGIEHLALVKGDMDELKTGAPLVRFHHESSIIDMLGENDAVNVQQMETAMTYINAQGSGVVVYLRGGFDGSSASMLATLKSYSRKMTDAPATTPVARTARKDLRDYGVSAQILSDLGVTRFRLITNNPRKAVALRGYGLEVADTVHFPSGEFKFSPRGPDQKAVVPAPKADVKQENKQTVDTPKTEMKAEARAPMTMRMGAQIISGQALFEG